MKPITVIADLHVHTKDLPSRKSSTLEETMEEMTRQAKEKGLCAIACTDHAPVTSNLYTAWSSQWPREPWYKNGVEIYRGAEADMLDFEGRISLPEETLKELSVTLAAFHTYCLKPEGSIAHTKGYEAALKNPYIDIIAHPAEPFFPCDYEYIMELAAREGKAIELNALSEANYPEAAEIQKKLASLAVKYHTLLAVSSDAQNPMQIGSFGGLLDMLAGSGIKSEQMINSQAKNLKAFIQRRSREKKERGIMASTLFDK